MTTPTLAQALIIARSTDRELHAADYTNVDVARECACEVLADEVERQAALIGGMETACVQSARMARSLEKRVTTAEAEQEHEQKENERTDVL